MWRLLLRLSSLKTVLPCVDINRAAVWGTFKARNGVHITLSRSYMKSLRVHLDEFNFPTSPAVDSTVKLLSVISVPAQPTAFWEIFEIYDCKINIQTNSCCSPFSIQHYSVFTAVWANACHRITSELDFSNLWCFGTCLSCISFLSSFFFYVITHLPNINATGKKRPGCKEGHRRHGSARDQIRRHGLLHHACGNRTLAVVPGARCQIITLRTSQEKGEFPLLCSGT